MNNQLAEWYKKFPAVKQGEPMGTFQPANWSAAGVKKAKGEAKPLERAPNKAPSNIARNTTSGMKLSFRKSRKGRKCKSRSSKSRKSSKK